MIIAQISDTHLLSMQGSDAAASLRARQAQQCVEAINRLPIQPAAVIHTGDMVNYDCNNKYELATEIFVQLKAPFYPTVGNRDSRSELVRSFLAPHVLASDARFCQYRIKLGRLDLISADTKSDTLRVGTSCPSRLRQLETLLQQDTETPVCIFLHHPPTRVPNLKNPLQFESEEHAAAFADLFDRFDNIVRIFCGHTHRSDMLLIGRHSASTHPSLATDIRLDHYALKHVGEPVFQLHELLSDGTLSSVSCFADSDEDGDHPGINTLRAAE